MSEVVTHDRIELQHHLEKASDILGSPAVNDIEIASRDGCTLQDRGGSADDDEFHTGFAELPDESRKISVFGM